MVGFGLRPCGPAVDAGLPAAGVGNREVLGRSGAGQSEDTARTVALTVTSKVWNCDGGGARTVGAMTCQLTWPQTIPWNETRITWNLLWVPPKTTVNVISDGQYWMKGLPSVARGQLGAPRSGWFSQLVSLGVGFRWAEHSGVSVGRSSVIIWSVRCLV